MISSSLGVPENILCLAKHRPAFHDWLILTDRSPAGSSKHSNKKNKKKKKGGGGGKGADSVKIDLKKAPYLLCDGDTIGVMVMQDGMKMDLIKEEDFSTQTDVEGRKRLEKEREAVRLNKQGSRKSLEAAAGEKSGPMRRQEQAIKRHVDDFILNVTFNNVICVTNNAVCVRGTFGQCLGDD